MIANYSRIKTRRLCARKDLFERIMKLQPVGKPRVELDYGHAIHEAIPTFLKTKSVSTAIDAFNLEFDKFLSNPYLLPEQVEEGKALARLGALTIQSYEETWKSDFELILAEYSGLAPLTDGEHQLAFRSDAVVAINRMLWLLERKTLSKSISVNTIIDSFNIDEQPTAYLVGLRKLTQLPISGFLLEIVRKTTIPEIIREPYLRSDDQLFDTEIGLAATIEEMQTADECYQQAGDNEIVLKHIFPKTTGTASCFQFFRPCAFLELCKSARLKPFGEEFVRKEDDYVDRLIRESKTPADGTAVRNTTTTLSADSETTPAADRPSAGAESETIA